MWRFWGVVVILVGLSGLALYRGLKGVDPNRRVVAAVLSVAFAAAAFLIFRWLRAAPPVVHDVAICFSRDEGEGSYFLATCECGWVGDVVATESDARADAAGHSPNVRPEIEYLHGPM